MIMYIGASPLRNDGSRAVYQIVDNCFFAISIQPPPLPSIRICKVFSVRRRASFLSPFFIVSAPKFNHCTPLYFSLATRNRWRSYVCGVGNLTQQIIRPSLALLTPILFASASRLLFHFLNQSSARVVWLFSPLA